MRQARTVDGKPITNIWICSRNERSNGIARVVITRPNPLGNPYKVEKYGRLPCIALFAKSIVQPWYKERNEQITRLRSLHAECQPVVLVCSVACGHGHPCHGDIIARYVTGEVLL